MLIYTKNESSANFFCIAANGKNDHLNKCWKIWYSCVMTWDGNIVPCCFNKDAKYTMGNIHEQSFREIWNGEKYHDFRARFFEDHKGIDICRNCTEGLKV